jgi:hypothetical protein
MPNPALFAGLMIAGVLLVAPLGPALADRDDPISETYESHDGAREHARERARKVRRQERGYRELEIRQRARFAAEHERRRARHLYRNPWGPFAGPPGLF